MLTQPTAYIQPGKHKKLTGYYALWFARSRFSTDDYDRMRRQRCLISDIVSQANPVKMLQKYPALAAVAKSNIATNIPRKDLPAWVTLIERMQKGTITSLPFTSSVVNTSDPDFPQIQSLVAKAIRASTRPATHHEHDRHDDSDGYVDHRVDDQEELLVDLGGRRQRLLTDDNLRRTGGQRGQVCLTSSSPSAYCLRSTFLSNLPTLVLGTSSMKAQRSGTCHLATRPSR